MWCGTDTGRTRDGRTDKRTDGVKPIYPQTTSYNEVNCKYTFIFPQIIYISSKQFCIFPDVLVKVSKILRWKMSRPEGDSNPKPSNSCRMPFEDGTMKLTANTHSSFLKWFIFPQNDFSNFLETVPHIKGWITHSKAQLTQASRTLITFYFIMHLFHIPQFPQNSSTYKGLNYT